jgi:hypothetical protein
MVEYEFRCALCHKAFTAFAADDATDEQLTEVYSASRPCRCRAEMRDENGKWVPIR